MSSNKNKLLLHESGVTESIPMLKPVNKHELTNCEQIIKDIIDNKFKDYELKSIQTPADSMFYNLEISTEKDDIDQNDLELQRFLIAQQLSKFKNQLFGELSKDLPVVNIKTGPYQFYKDNSNRLCFNVTVLLSNQDVKDWVTGKVKRDHNKDKKEEISKEENFMESKKYMKHSKDLLEDNDPMKHFESSINKIYNLFINYPLTEVKPINDIELKAYKALTKDGFLRPLENNKYDSSQDAFQATDKFEQLSLEKFKNYFDLNMLNDIGSHLYDNLFGRFYQDDKYDHYKHNKFSESKKYKKNNNKSMKRQINNFSTIGILESIYKQRNKHVTTKSTAPILRAIHYDMLTEKKDLVNTRSDDLEGQLGKSKLDKLDSLIKEYKQIKDSIEKRSIAFNKSLEKDEKLMESDKAKVDALMTKMQLTEYVVDGIVAKITQRKSDKGITKYKKVVEEALIKLNEEGKKLLNRLIKKNTEFREYPKELNIESKKLRKINKLIEMIEYRTGRKVLFEKNTVSKIKDFIKSIAHYYTVVKEALQELEIVENKL